MRGTGGLCGVRNRSAVRSMYGEFLARLDGVVPLRRGSATVAPVETGTHTTNVNALALCGGLLLRVLR
ncbi:hypothetical protein NOGI109294_24410 [Nocardiopsis gilva]